MSYKAFENCLENSLLSLDVKITERERMFRRAGLKMTFAGAAESPWGCVGACIRSISENDRPWTCPPNATPDVRVHHH